MEKLKSWADTILSFGKESGELSGHTVEMFKEGVNECLERNSIVQMRMAVSDLKEMATGMAPECMIGLNRILREKFGEDLSSRMARSMAAVLRRGKIRNDDEFVRVNEWIDHLLYDRDNPDAEQQIEQYNRMLRDYEEKAARSAALQEATLYATEVPLRTMKAASRVFEIVRAMASEGNPNSVSDAGVGALAARSAVLGACLNVKINAAGLKDRAVADALTAEAEALAAEAVRLEAEVLQIVESKIG